MTMESIYQGIAAQIKSIFSGAKVHSERIPKDSEGKYFIGLISQSTDEKLDNGCEEKYAFEILFFRDPETNLGFAEWAQKLHRNFLKVDVGGFEAWVTEKESRKTDEFVYQFTFSIRLRLREKKNGTKMLNIDQEVKYGEKNGAGGA